MNTPQTPTVARVREDNGAHFYLTDGTPLYEVAYADPRKGKRKATLSDARKMGALPSVTTIIQILDKPALTAWKIEQATLAVLTSERLPNEALDAFVDRVLNQEKQQSQETETARDKGSAIHDGLELWFSQGPHAVEPSILPWIEPAAQAIAKYGKIEHCEKVLVGDRYAGKTDLIQKNDTTWWLWDYKTTKKLPDPKKGAWSEHRLQLSAYAAAFWASMGLSGTDGIPKPIRCANCYISTVEQGAFVICHHHDWQRTFNAGFAPLVNHWHWANNYP